MAKFKFSERYRYWWQVVTNAPSDTKPGHTEKQTFQVEFEPVTATESKEWDERVAREPTVGGIENDVNFLVSVIRGWKDVADGDGQDVEFTEENLRAALEWTWFRTAVFKAYYASQSGEAARLGN